MQRIGSSLGAGLYLSHKQWLGWISAGGGIEQAKWNDLEINGQFGRQKINGSVTNKILYVQGAITRKRGGLTAMLRADVLNLIPLLAVGWNFGTTQSRYDLPAVVRR